MVERRSGGRPEPRAERSWMEGENWRVSTKDRAWPISTRREENSWMDGKARQQAVPSTFPSPFLPPTLSLWRSRRQCIGREGSTFQVDASGVGRNLRAIDWTTRRKSNRSCVSQAHLRPARVRITPPPPPPAQHSPLSVIYRVSSPTLSTRSTRPTSTELTSAPERHPFRSAALECGHSVDDSSRRSLYVVVYAAQRSDSCIIRHPARHYNALLLLIESIVSRLAVGLTGTAKSAKSRRATWCNSARDSSLGMVSLERREWTG